MKRVLTITLYGLAILAALPLLLFMLSVGAMGGWPGVVLLLVMALMAGLVCFGLPLIVTRIFRAAWTGALISLILVILCWAIIGGQNFGPLKTWHDLSQSWGNSHSTPEQNYLAAQAILKTHPNEVHFDGDNDAFAKMSSAAHQGYMPAQYELGMMYYNGFAMHLDHDQSQQWLQKAADAGHAKAKAELAFRHWWRDDRKPEDFAEEQQRFRDAGVEGMAVIPVNIRLSVDASQLPSWQQDERVALMKLSANAGNVAAMKQLAEAYAKGQCNLKPDAKEAARYEKMAANNP